VVVLLDCELAGSAGEFAQDQFAVVADDGGGE
jgi:hypothetical protein